MLMVTVSLSVCHPRERGDLEGAVFQALRAKDKRKVNPVNKKPCFKLRIEMS